MNLDTANLARSAALALAGGMLAGALPATAQTAAQVAEKPVVPPKPAKLPDGHPNWTGFWSAKGGMLDRNIGLGGTDPAAADKSAGVGAPFIDFPPLKSPYKERLNAYMLGVMKTGEAPDPVAKCFPPGFPRMMIMVYGMEILQTPQVISIMSEWQAEPRRIWLDRNSHPPDDELDPSYGGDSIGHWEGDTLVVDTVGIRDDVPLNFTGLMHSAKLHVVEHIHALSPGILADDFTIEDPDVFTGPWHHREIYRYRPDLRLEEFVCLQNNRNVGEHGEATFNR